MRQIQENKRKLYIQTSTIIKEEWKNNNPTKRDSRNICKSLWKNLKKHTKETRKKKTAAIFFDIEKAYKKQKEKIPLNNWKPWESITE